VADGGTASLARAWTGPDTLPSAAEIEDPGRWIARIGARPTELQPG